MWNDVDGGTRVRASVVGKGASWLAALVLVLAATSCGSADDGYDPKVALVKVQPSSLRAPGAASAELWKLFDRSTSTSWDVKGSSDSQSLSVTFDEPVDLVAIKFYSDDGTPPELIDAVGNKVDVAFVEPSESGRQWHKLLLKKRHTFPSLTLQFASTESARAIGEVEFWTTADSPPAKMSAAAALDVAFSSTPSNVANVL